MENNMRICVTCLSKDRRLVPLHKIRDLLKEIRFIEIKVNNHGICWECNSLIRKYHKFRSKAFNAQAVLSKCGKVPIIKPLTELGTKTNILYDYEYYHYDPLTDCDTDPKIEDALIKQEYDDMENNIDEKIPQEMLVSVVVEKLPEINAEIPHIDGKLSKVAEDYEKLSEDNMLEEKLPEVDTEMLQIHDELSDVGKILSVVNTEMLQIDDKLSEDEVKLSEVDENVQEPNGKGSYANKINSSRFKRATKAKDIDEQVPFDELNKMFIRIVLTDEEMMKAREDKRSHYNFKKLPFKCDYCVLGFTRKDKYDVHMKTKHEKSVGYYKCDVCAIRFTSVVTANNHKERHYVCYRCLLCNHETSELWSVLNHCKTKHRYDRVDRIHCEQCKDVFKNAKELEEHVQAKHVLSCNECGVKLKDKHTLRGHMARIHAIKREFICDICKKTFMKKSRLESHMVTHNQLIAERLAYCPICKIQYKNLCVFRNHLKNSAIHSQRAYSCPECKKSFASKVYFTNHYNFYHLHKSEYNCEICNKLFISKWRLKNHRQKHHGLSRTRDHPCNICGKTFYNSSILRNHQLTHSEQRTFMCEDCGDTFKQRPALYTHAKLVHGEGRKK